MAFDGIESKKGEKREERFNQHDFLESDPRGTNLTKTR